MSDLLIRRFLSIDACRVCHLTSAHPRDDTRILLKECHSLVRAGYAVFFVVADGKKNEFKDGVSIIDVGVSHGRIRRMLGATRRVLAAARKIDADIYHFHDPELLPVGVKLSRLGKQVIFDAHEDLGKQMLSKHYLNKSLRRILAWAYETYERQCLHYFSAVIAATPTIQVKYSALHSLAVAVNNYPMVDELHLSDVTAQKTASTSICYVGGICQIRGIIELVQALQVVRHPVRLQLAGNFTDSEELVRTMPGWSKVNMLGYINRDGIRNTLNSSIAGLVTLHPTPNYVESLPVKMFEYMAAGIPVIASDFPLWRQIVEGNRCGICVNPLDPVDIARAIETLIANPTMAQEMGANGRRAVIKRYNWGQEERALIDLYARMVDD